jgi:hypothetical protein
VPATASTAIVSAGGPAPRDRQTTGRRDVLPEPITVERSAKNFMRDDER